ncbi:hypothetical protein FAZ95_10705 [Trinickia violacea]|uniref:Uncharacterized protein n=1 Tax=Trinickia violacea TaxID=2571746 RepID=A0A4P8IL31_9BURK|nr:hypothetical protein [Trinickia violacea]QCP49598.1 hypothetical protein FAZ95_10705 [Trinickia violacea]
MNEQPIVIVPARSSRPEAVLPEPFAALRPFVSVWALPTETERNIRRHQTPMADIVAFSDAMLAHVDAIVSHLNALDVNALPAEATALMQLLLSLAEIAPVIEFYRQPAVVDGYDPRRFAADETFVLRPAL